MTTADKIRRFLAKGVRPVEIAAKLGVNVKRVHKIKWQDKTKAKKEKPKITRKVLLEELMPGLDALFSLDTPPKTNADPRAKEWHKQNPWFGKDQNKTAKALRLHELLMQEGVDPKSNKYWDRIDIGMMDQNIMNRDKNKEDIVNKPPHYTTGGIDFLDYAEAKGLTMNAYLFNVVKYVSRAGKKTDTDPLIDLKKAEFYLKREIANRQRG